MSEGTKEVIQGIAECLPDLAENEQRELLGIAKGAAMVRRAFNEQEQERERQPAAAEAG